MHIVKLVAIKAKVLFHARYEGIIDIDLRNIRENGSWKTTWLTQKTYLVEILDKVAQRGKSHKHGIKFEEKPPLIWRFVECVPDV